MTDRVFDLKQAIVTVKFRKGKTVAYNKKAIEEISAEMLPLDRDSEEWAELRSIVAKMRRSMENPGLIYCDFKVQLKHWSKYEYTYESIRIDNPYYNTMSLLTHVKTYARDAIKRRRTLAKRNETSYELWHNVEIQFTNGKKKKGRIFSQPDQVLKAHIQKNMKTLYTEKKPENINRYIGIELEFCAPVTKEQMAFELFKEGFQKFVQLKEDGSLRPKKENKELGFEIAMLLRENSYKKDLKKVLDFLQKIKAVTEERRCGLHVHFDMRKRDKNRVYSNLVSCQHVLSKMVDPRRVDGEFCKLVHSKTFPTKFNGSREERYKTINAAAYYRHQTLEIRMHEGSVDFKAISMWTDILLKVVNYPKKLKSNISQLTIFQKRFKLNKHMYQTVLDKSCFWEVNQADLVRDNDRRFERLDMEQDEVANGEPQRGNVWREAMANHANAIMENAGVRMPQPVAQATEQRTTRTAIVNGTNNTGLPGIIDNNGELAWTLTVDNTAVDQAGNGIPEQFEDDIEQ